MDIKQILKKKIESAKKELEVAKTQSTSEAVCFQAKVDAYYDCLTLIEQFERPTKVIPNRFFFECPKCHEYLASTYPHCPYCGQLLDYDQGEKK
jgi:hypothetical protein